MCSDYFSFGFDSDKEFDKLWKDIVEESEHGSPVENDGQGEKGHHTKESCIESKNDYEFPEFRSIAEIKQVVTKAKLDVDSRKREQNFNIKKKEYIEFRNEACAIQLLLNHVGMKAPAFRSGVKPRPKFGNSEKYIDYELSNDRQVIDLHWLFLHYKDEIDTEDDICKGLFNKNEFDFKLANKIVKEKGSSELKAGILGLTNNIQLELASIHEKPIRDMKRQVIVSERKEAKKRIRNTSKKLDKNAVNGWADVYVALRLSLGDIAFAKMLYGLIRGDKPISPDSNLMSNKRATLENKYLGLSRDAWLKLENPFK